MERLPKRSTGGTYHNHGVHVVRMRWRKIVEIDANEDSEAVANMLKGNPRQESKKRWPDRELTIERSGRRFFRSHNLKGESMTREARLLSGIILITIPTIQYGGYFLLTSLMSKTSGYMENPLRQNFFRAGHAHAGVIVILSLVCQIHADTAVLPSPLVWFVRIGVPLSAIFISAGFFFSILPPAATEPSRAVGLIYAGAVILAISVITLAVGLIRTSAST